jgi:sodium/potassium/calcium exchanger 6
VNNAIDKCAFVRANCQDEDAGLLSYLGLYYCNLGNFHVLAMGIIVLWVCSLFSTIGIAASDFFCVNLSTISTILGLSENLAGVTFLAFGNGSPDVFSTFAAMKSNSGSLAVGELIGAAGFITAVIAGSMAFVKPFKVAKKSFVRDVSFFIVATTFTLFFLYDGALYLWESVFMVVLYILYVCLVVTWHWYMTKRKRKRLAEAAARSQYIVPGSGAEELGDRYRDDEDGAAESTPAEDFTALEDQNLDEEDMRERYLGQISSKMRVVTRPRRPTYLAIRPSLVGALEFRSVLAGLRKSRNIQSYQLASRRYSDDLTLAQAGPDRSITVDTGTLGTLEAGRPDASRTASGNRQRAVSAIEPRAGPSTLLPTIDFLQELPNEEAETDTIKQHNLFPRSSPAISISPPPSAEPSRSSSPLPPAKKSETLAPPGALPLLDTFQGHQPNDYLNAKPIASSQAPSSGTTEFPLFSDGSMFASPESSRSASPLPRSDSNRLVPQVHDVGVEEHISRPITWWPNKLLPPPMAILNTLFPMFENWADKMWWERALAIVSAPSIFLLTITLPVVELPRDDEEDKDTSPVTESTPNTAATFGLNTQHRNGSEDLLTGHVSPRSDVMSQPVQSVPVINLPGAAPEEPPGSPVPSEPPKAIVSSPLTNDWNRWLVVLQVFTAPFFVVLVVWANTNSDHPQKLIRPTLISLIISLVTLAFILLTTSPDRAPRWHPLLCFAGFVVSISWISTIAGEVVGVLKALGVILNISDAILGLTIFAVGNSLGDLVADITVARLGFPVMALSACFGGPMLNILLGIGLSGMYMSISGAQEKHAKHPNKKMKFKPFIVDVDRTLLVSGMALLVTLVGLLIVVPLRGWRMDKLIGWCLIGLWAVATLGNVGLEIWSGDGHQHAG